MRGTRSFQPESGISDGTSPSRCGEGAVRVEWRWGLVAVFDYRMSAVCRKWRSRKGQLFRVKSFKRILCCRFVTKRVVSFTPSPLFDPMFILCVCQL